MIMEKAGFTSVDIGRAALKIAVTATRMEEQQVKAELAAKGIRSTAVDFGGEFVSSITKIVERAVVAAERQGIVKETHVGAGAVAGFGQFGGCGEAVNTADCGSVIRGFDPHQSPHNFSGLPILGA
jgi:hypothetical protein